MYSDVLGCTWMYLDVPGYTFTVKELSPVEQWGPILELGLIEESGPFEELGSFKGLCPGLL
jgi:hypothetical protein